MLPPVPRIRRCSCPLPFSWRCSTSTGRFTANSTPPDHHWTRGVHEKRAPELPEQIRSKERPLELAWESVDCRRPWSVDGKFVAPDLGARCGGGIALSVREDCVEREPVARR